MAQAAGGRYHLRRVIGKKRVIAEEVTDALRVWDEAIEKEKCPREDSFSEIYAALGDTDAQTAIRDRTPHKHHCRWLRKDPNACTALPAASGVPEDKIGQVCPHNIYEAESELFMARDAQAERLSHIFRMLKAAEIGLMTESDLDPFQLTEMLTAQTEIERIRQERQERESERMRGEQQARRRH